MARTKEFETFQRGVRYHLDPLGILAFNVKWSKLGGEQFNPKLAQNRENGKVASVQFWPQPLTYAIALCLQSAYKELYNILS